MVVKPLQPTKEKTVGIRSKLLGKGTIFSQVSLRKKMKLYPGVYKNKNNLEIKI